jgi:hypothetical protein
MIQGAVRDRDRVRRHPANETRPKGCVTFAVLSLFYFREVSPCNGAVLMGDAPVQFGCLAGVFGRPYREAFRPGAGQRRPIRLGLVIVGGGRLRRAPGPGCGASSLSGPVSGRPKAPQEPLAALLGRPRGRASGALVRGFSDSSNGELLDRRSKRLSGIIVDFSGISITCEAGDSGRAPAAGWSRGSVAGEAARSWARSEVVIVGLATKRHKSGLRG